MMFDKLSESSKTVLAIAVTESQLLNHAYIGTTHFFIGLCKIADDNVGNVFKKFNIDPLIRRELRAKIGIGNGPHYGKDVNFSSRVFEIFNMTNNIADRFQSPVVEPIHLLLGLLYGGEGEAVKMLKEKSVNVDEMKAYIENYIQSSPQLKSSPYNKKTPYLNKIGRDLTDLAKKGKLDLIVGRSKEIKKIAQILTLKKKNNPVLVGEAGVGKTAVVEGLALRLIGEDLPDELTGLRIIEVSVASLVASTKLRGEFEENILKMIEEASKNKNVILFIDEIHTLVGAGSAGGALDASNILKPALDRGEIRCIGATTIEEYKRYIEKDPALERRFQPVVIKEPTIENAISILKGLRETYEKHHGIKISDEAISAAVNLSARYIIDRKLPDKALDLLDQSASRKKLNSLTIHSREELEKELLVTAEDIANVVAEITGIPASNLTESEGEKLLRMEEALSSRVIGQDEAIKSLAAVIRTTRAGLNDTHKPIGVFLFLGPTGVGKTELAKALAEFLFDDENKLIRIDMSEYMEKHNLTRLIGAPPGYIGHDEDGQLTEAVRRHPYSVILLDEIEKAHPEIFNLFLQVFDDGRLTDSKGRVVDFTNTIIIMTSNIAAEKKKVVIGFNQSPDDLHSVKADNENEDPLHAELGQVFRTEFLNRIDKIIFFNPITKNNLRKIIDKQINGVRKSLLQRGIILDISDEVYDYLIENGYSERFGVREMSRFIKKAMVESLAENIFAKKFTSGTHVYVKIVSNNIQFLSEHEIKTQ